MKLFTKKNITRCTAGLLAGSVLVVAGCQQQEILNFYQVLSAGATFSNYQYAIAMDSSVFSSPASAIGGISANSFSGIALKGIVTDGTAFSTSLLFKIDDKYEEATQIVVRDNRMYIDVASLFNVIQKISPDSYTALKQSIDNIKQGIEQQPEQYAEMFKQYGLTVDDVKDRLDKNIGWVYVSFSTLDKGLDTVKSANETFKDAISINTVESLDTEKYPEAAKLVMKKFSAAVEKRFGSIEPSFTDVKNGGEEYTFHLYNDNMEAFLDGCAAFMSEDLMSIIDDSINVLTQNNISGGVDVLTECKNKLTEKTADGKSALEAAVEAVTSAKKSFSENKDKSSFDWLSAVSLKGGQGERVWKLSNNVTASMPSSIPSDAQTLVESSDVPTEMSANITITLKEFKDAASAVAAMDNPAETAYCLDTALLSVMDSAAGMLSSYGGGFTVPTTDPASDYSFDEDSQDGVNAPDDAPVYTGGESFDIPIDDGSSAVTTIEVKPVEVIPSDVDLDSVPQETTVATIDVMDITTVDTTTAETTTTADEDESALLPVYTRNLGYVDMANDLAETLGETMDSFIIPSFSEDILYAEPVNDKPFVITAYTKKSQWVVNAIKGIRGVSVSAGKTGTSTGYATDDSLYENCVAHMLRCMLSDQMKENCCAYIICDKTGRTISCAIVEGTSDIEYLKKNMPTVGSDGMFDLNGWSAERPDGKYIGTYSPNV